MPNKYSKLPIRPLIFPIGPSIVYVPLTLGLYALIESEDAALIGMNNWHMSKDYAARMIYTPKPKKIFLHCEILKARDGFVTDHKNGNRLDCRKCGNLRELDRSGNSQNCKLSNRNTSGHKGLYWNKPRKRWDVSIVANNKRIRLGSSRVYEKAVEIRRAAELIYHRPEVHKFRHHN